MVVEFPKEAEALAVTEALTETCTPATMALAFAVTPMLVDTARVAVLVWVNVFVALKVVLFWLACGPHQIRKSVAVLVT